MSKYLIFALILGFPSLAHADVKDAMQSVCRIYVTYNEVDENNPTVKVVKAATGSGVVYQEDEKKYWIMTAGHVIHKSDLTKIEVEFFVEGFQTIRFAAKEAWKNYTIGEANDLAILYLEKEKLAGWKKPTVTPIAPRTRRLKVRQTVLSTGCPQGSWPTTLMGHINAVHKDIFRFVPNPHKGRSGSPIFDEDGKEIIGIVIWQDTVNHHHGTAISIDGIYRFTKWEKSQR